MILPRPSNDFEWVDAQGGAALVCRPLERLARHIVTTRSWSLGSPSGGSGDAWGEIAKAVDAKRVLRVHQIHGAEVLVHRATRPAAAPADADIIVSVPEGKSVNVYLGVGDITASNVKGNLRLDTSSGRVDASGTKGDLTIDTGSGDVKVTGASGSTVSIDTGSGEVNGTDIKATSLDVDTGSGDVELSDVMSEDVTIDTGSGSVNLALKAALDRLKVDTGSGSVTITVPGTLSAQVAIETGSGDITTDFPIQVRKTGGDELIGTIGSGTGRIDIDTGSGDVRLLKRP